MVKMKRAYVCGDCGNESQKWVGQCSACGAWNSMSEVILHAPQKGKERTGYAGAREAKVVSLSDVTAIEFSRITTNLEELDRVLGGGLVPGGVILIGGDPGIGKSTLIIQAIHNLSQHHKTLYVTGEESLEQIALRAQRLGLNCSAISAFAEISVEAIVDVIQKTEPKVVVIDSIQTLFSNMLEAAPGSVSQVRECAASLVRLAKQTNTILFLIGHVTKEGAIAGPRVLEHMVDTVLYFESNQAERYRFLRAIKNRFGASNELGIFAMTEKGLKGVSNPSAIFINHNKENDGSIVTVLWEGTRPLLAEVQALVDDSSLENPRRVAIGINQQRMTLIIAVLSRHAKIRLAQSDVFVNVVGGLSVEETGADLSILAAILCSKREIKLKKRWCIFGEVGLAGEVRPISFGTERLKEAEKHGFEAIILPKANLPKNLKTSMKVYGIEHVSEIAALIGS